MRYSSIFSHLARAVFVLAATAAATVSAQSALPPPQFTAILTGKVTPSTQMNTTGPFGTRVHNEGTSGDLLDATTGEVVGTVLSFADNGVTSDSGLTFPSGMMPITWSTDGHFASASFVGVGSVSSNTVWSYVHLETDSPTYSELNGKFLIMQTDTSDLSFTIYEETSSSAGGST